MATAGGFLLNGGEKKWIGNGSVGGTTVVWARAEDGQVHGYLVPQDSPPGYCATTIQGKSSLRAIWQAHIRLENVFVPAENVLPGANSFKDTTRVLLATRLGGWPGPPSVMPRLLRDRRAVCGAARSIRPPLGRLADRSGTPGQNAVRTGHDAADSGPDDPSGRIGGTSLPCRRHWQNIRAPELHARSRPTPATCLAAMASSLPTRCSAHGRYRGHPHL